MKNSKMLMGSTFSHYKMLMRSTFLHYKMLMEIYRGGRNNENLVR